MIIPLKINIVTYCLFDKLGLCWQIFEEDDIEHLVINSDISNYRTLWNIKRILGDTLGGAQISVAKHTCNQIEMTDMDEINEIVYTSHKPLLGMHRGLIDEKHDKETAQLACFE